MSTCYNVQLLFPTMVCGVLWNGGVFVVGLMEQGTPCLESTLVSTHSWLVSTPHSVPSSCTLWQLVVIASNLAKMCRFGVPFTVLTKQGRLY